MRLLDLACNNCGLIFEDVWDDEIPEFCAHCTSNQIRVILLKAPHMDACVPPERTGGQNFMSHYAMEKHAKATGQVVLSPKEYERMKKTTTEDRLKKKHSALRKAVEQSYYRVKNGYVDHPPKTTLKETR